MPSEPYVALGSFPIELYGDEAALAHVLGKLYDQAVAGIAERPGWHAVPGSAREEAYFTRLVEDGDDIAQVPAIRETADTVHIRLIIQATDA